MITARVFRKFAKGRAFEYRKEIYRFLTICNATPRELLPMVFESNLLSAAEMEMIAETYYGHFAG